MKIQSFKVKNLFDYFNYDFQIDASRDIFLLTGPNGYGKTTILTILSELARGNFYYFYVLPFEKIEISFDSDDRVEIQTRLITEIKEELFSDNEIQPDKVVSFKWYKKDKLISKFQVSKNDLLSCVNNIKYKTFFLNKSAFDVLSSDFATEIEKHLDRQSSILEHQDASQFSLFLKTLTIQILSTNRLVAKIQDESNRSISAISYVAEKLQDLLREHYMNYLREVNYSNSSLFDKLLNNIEPLEKSEYQDKADILSSKLIQLNEWGLCRDKNIREYKDEYKEILTVYLSEMERNLNIYNELYAQLLLFKAMLEKKQFINKNIRFDPYKGIEVRTQNQLIIDLNKLSSGEQHEIIMLYYAIFEVGKNSVLLIDEPENSLHVAWQNHYLEDMEHIAKVMNIQILIATHSPQIIGGRWDDCYDLYEAIENGKFNSDSRTGE